MKNMAQQQMKQMPSLPTLASALCHIATIAVIMRGRTDLATAPGVAGVSHRNLESAEPPHDPPLVNMVLGCKDMRTWRHAECERRREREVA